MQVGRAPGGVLLLLLLLLLLQRVLHWKKRQRRVPTRGGLLAPLGSPYGARRQPDGAPKWSDARLRFPQHLQPRRASGAGQERGTDELSGRPGGQGWVLGGE